MEPTGRENPVPNAIIRQSQWQMTAGACSESMAMLKQRPPGRQGIGGLMRLISYKRRRSVPKIWGFIERKRL